MVHMDRIAQLIIYSGHLGMFNFGLGFEEHCKYCSSIHTYCYLFQKYYKQFRHTMAHRTGLILTNGGICGFNHVNQDENDENVTVEHCVDHNLAVLLILCVFIGYLH